MDLANDEFGAIKKIFDLKTAPVDYEKRRKTAAALRHNINEVFTITSQANDVLQARN